MPETITRDDARYALDLVKTICTQVGPGIPGSRQERERAEIIKRELESALGAENVVVEEFTFAPRAFLGSLPISALLMLLAVVLNLSTGRFTGSIPWVTSLSALALSIINPILVVSEFVLGVELVDRFFKQKQSLNVIGRLRKPGTNQVKHLLLVSGHHDSAPENTWLRFLRYGFLVVSPTMVLAPIVMLVMSILQLTGVLTSSAGLIRLGTLGWVLLVYPVVPAIIITMFFTRGWKGGGNVPGAVDNLSASALAVAICRFLVQNPAYIPEDTEIRFISFGSEEAAVRGSRRYVARHLDELKRLDARTLNIEMVAYPEILILESNVNGTVKNSPEMVSSVIAAAQRARVPYKVVPVFFGGPGDDAAPFSQAGLKATTLLPFKMPQQMVAFYHQKWDTPEVLTIEPLFNVLKLTFEWVRCGGE